MVTNDPKTPAKTTAHAAKPAAGNPTNEASASLSFDDVTTIPGASQRAALTNPFQAKVNALAETGGASSVVVPDDDVEWARKMVRAAASAINKGSVTKFAPATQNADGTGEMLPGKSRVWFSIGDKRARKS